MNISYTEPLARAWLRTKRMLFRPFRIEAWFVIGFSAFLARLFTHSGSGAQWNAGGRGDRHVVERGIDSARDAFGTLLEHPFLMLAMTVGLILLGVLVLVLAWVSARAEFVFLDNVATGRAEFTAAWRRVGALGRSLFLWRAAFSFAYLPPLVLILMPFVSALVTTFQGGDLHWPHFASIAVGLGSGLLLLLLLAWISMFMDDFVVPLMYRYGENATQAWGRFWPLLTGNFGSFLAYTVFLFFVSVTVLFALLIAGVGTCCIGLVLMMVPYVGSVVLLPVLTTWRGLGPEFMAQFGPEWSIFAAEPTEADDDAGPVV